MGFLKKLNPLRKARKQANKAKAAAEQSASQQLELQQQQEEAAKIQTINTNALAAEGDTIATAEEPAKTYWQENGNNVDQPAFQARKRRTNSSALGL